MDIQKTFIKFYFQINLWQKESQIQIRYINTSGFSKINMRDPNIMDKKI